MQYIAIKQEEFNGEQVFTVNAIPLKNKNQSVVQKIPHPLGSDILRYKTLDDAKEAISRAGFSYILPDGKKETAPRKTKQTQHEKENYEDLIYSAIRGKINSSNSNVSAAAILAISEFPTEETFDILFDKLGEENDIIRKNAISGICRYGKLLSDKIIKALSSDNWVARNSALTCISNIATDINIDLEKFIPSIVKATEDANPIVQSNALTTLALVYKNYKKSIRN